jgi:glycosyltransferase involved in cell wall biosynthesis
MTDQTPQLSVMQIVLDLKRAGAQEVVRTLAEYLQKSGCKVIVCAFADGPVRADIEKLGIKVEILKRPRYSVIFLPLFIVALLRIRRELANLVRTYQVDVAQTHILQMLDFLVLSLRFGTSLQVVLWTFQNVEFLPKHKHWLLKPKRFVYKWLYRLLARRADGFVAVSAQVHQAIMKQVGPVEDKIFTICNAVDLTPFEPLRNSGKARLCTQLGLAPDACLIIIVGRLTKQKGHQYLIEAAPTIVAAYPNTHFLFVGEGELHDALQAQIQQINLMDHFHFLGVRDDVPHLLTAVDLFVQPSLWEGLSVALLEAMAAGKPIVATAVSGTTQAMVNGQTGLMVPITDSAALAKAIIQLLADPIQAQVMGRMAREHVALNFSAQKQAEEHLALYYRLLSAK